MSHCPLGLELDNCTWLGPRYPCILTIVNTLYGNFTSLGNCFLLTTEALVTSLQGAVVVFGNCNLLIEVLGAISGNSNVRP
jgi:hypothetical protein